MDKQAQMEFHIRQAEEAYSRMYDVSSSTEAAAAASDFKASFVDAIRLAKELGLQEKAAELEKRYHHCVTVYRRQFS